MIGPLTLSDGFLRELLTLICDSLRTQEQILSFLENWQDHDQRHFLQFSRIFLEWILAMGLEEYQEQEEEKDWGKEVPEEELDHLK